MTLRDVGVVPVFEDTDSCTSHSRTSSASSLCAAKNSPALGLHGTHAGHRGERGDPKEPATAAEREALGAVTATQHRTEAMHRVSKYFRDRGALPFEQSAVLFPDFVEGLTNSEGQRQGAVLPSRDMERSDACDEDYPSAPLTGAPNDSRRLDTADVFRSAGAGTTALNLLAISSSTPPSSRGREGPADALLRQPATASALGTRHTNTGRRTASPPHSGQLLDAATHRERTPTRAHKRSKIREGADKGDDGSTHPAAEKGHRSPKLERTKKKKSDKHMKKITSVVRTQSTSAPPFLGDGQVPSRTSSPTLSADPDGAVTATAPATDAVNRPAQTATSSPAPTPSACRVRPLLPTFSAIEERRLFDESSDAEDASVDRGDGRLHRAADAPGASEAASVAVTVFPDEHAARRYYTQDVEDDFGQGGAPKLRSHLYYEQSNGLFVDRRAHAVLELERAAHLAQHMAREEDARQREEARRRLHRGSRRLAMVSGGSGGGGAKGSKYTTADGTEGHRQNPCLSHNGDGEADVPPVSWEEQREDAVYYRLNVLSLLRYMMRVYYYLSAFTCGVSVMTLILACAPALAEIEYWRVAGLADLAGTPDIAFPSRVRLTVALLSVFDPSLFLFLCLTLVVTGLSPLVWSVAEGQWIQVRLDEIRRRLAAIPAEVTKATAHAHTPVACASSSTDIGFASRGATVASVSDVLTSVAGSVTAGRERPHCASYKAGSGAPSGHHTPVRGRRLTGWPAGVPLDSASADDELYNGEENPRLQAQNSFLFSRDVRTRAQSRSSGALEMSMPSLAQRRVSTRLSLVPLHFVPPSSMNHHDGHHAPAAVYRPSFGRESADERTENSGIAGGGRVFKRPPSASVSPGVSFSVQPTTGGAAGMSVGSILVHPSVGAAPPTASHSAHAGAEAAASPSAALSAAWEGMLSGTDVPDYYTQALSFVLDGALHADNFTTRVLEDTQRRVLASCCGRSWTVQSFWVLLQPRHWLNWICLALTVVELAMVDEQSVSKMLFASKESDEGRAVTIVFAILIVRAVLFSMIWLLNVFC